MSFYVPLALAALCVLLFETDIIIPGWGANNTVLQFQLLACVELMVVAFIPLALYLFRIKKVSNDLRLHPVEALRKWGLVRLALLAVPLVVCTFLYYVTMNVAYGYLAIILLICLVFVYPSKVRCEQETTFEEE